MNEINYKVIKNRFEAVTKKKIHHLFERGFIQYDLFLKNILASCESNEKFFLYSDFCPIKNSLNLDDVNRFILLKYLQDSFNVPVIIQIKDNHSLVRDEVNASNAGDINEIKRAIAEKHFLTENLNVKQLKSSISSVADKFGSVKENYRMTCMELISNDCIKDIISLGFNPDLTFICRHLDYVGHEPAYFECIIRSGMFITLFEAIQVYKIDFSDSIQTVSLAAKDVAALFSTSYPQIFNGETNLRCLVIPGTSPIIKKSLSSLAHKVATNLHYPTPATLQIDKLPSLQPSVALQSMSTIEPLTCIFLSDSDKKIKDKINKMAFSGGKDSIEEHRRLGGDCEVDVSYQYLRYFMEDSALLEDIRQRYSNGEMLTGELKKVTIDVLCRIIGDARERRSTVTQNVLDVFTRVRNLSFSTGIKTVEGEVFESLRLEEEVSEMKVEDEINMKEENDEKEDGSGDIVTPWEVIGNVDTGIDYDKLIERYGSTKVTEDLVDRFEQVTGKKAHHFLRRGMFYSHREFNEILDAYEKGQKFFLYTGRGPSSEALHLGHMVPFIFTQWLQEIFDVPLVIQLTDDEKCLMRNIDIKEVQRLAIENAKDIIAMGFDINKTFVFRDLEYMGQEPAFYQTAFRIGSKVTVNQVKGIFGFSGSDNVEKVAFPATQAAPSFSCSFPAIFGSETRLRALIPCAIDQDPYFRMTRDVAPRLDMPKPALIHSRFFPALQGNRTKMNASDPNSAIFMTDSAESIADKITNHAFSIGPDHRGSLTEEEVCQRDICYQYLTFFLADDDRLETVRQGLMSGRLTDRDIKAELISVLTPMVERHAAARAVTTDEVVRGFMTPRPLNYVVPRGLLPSVAAAVPPSLGDSGSQ